MNSDSRSGMELKLEAMLEKAPWKQCSPPRIFDPDFPEVEDRIWIGSLANELGFGSKASLARALNISVDKVRRYSANVRENCYMQKKPGQPSLLTCDQEAEYVSKVVGDKDKQVFL